MEEYRRKVSELQERGLRPRSSHRLGAGLKSVGGNIRDGVGNVISKPKELASKLKHKVRVVTFALVTVSGPKIDKH